MAYKLSDLKINPSNPRIIKDEKFQKLCKSIKEFPKMLKLRPIVIDGDNIVLGGNMRLKALQELGYKQIPDEWVRRADELTDDERRRFIIEDNVGFGEWDWEALANEWDEQELKDWALDVPIYDTCTDPFNDGGITAENKYGVIVTCETAIEQEEIYNDLTAKGYKCKVVVV